MDFWGCHGEVLSVSEIKNQGVWKVSMKEWDLPEILSCIWGPFKCATMQRGWYQLDRSSTGVIFYWVFVLQTCFYDICTALLVHETHSKGGKEAYIRGKNLLLVWAWTLFNDSEDIMSSQSRKRKLPPCHWKGKVWVQLIKRRGFHEMSWSLLRLQPNTHFRMHNIYLCINLNISMLLHSRKREEVVMENLIGNQ